jgi:hypothetical protein
MVDSFFGYGSLVNAATHDYSNTRPATLRGWRRVWVQSATRNTAFLSVKPDPLSSISGLVADIGDIGWDILDQREAAYDRKILNANGFEGITLYQAKPSAMAPLGSGKPVLLSYLDCVVQGFSAVYGTDGVRDFFRTTTGWDTPILNDRTAPMYPRAQTLTEDETKLTDDHIAMVGAQVIQLT